MDTRIIEVALGLALVAWVHTRDAGKPDLMKSRSAASQMASAFGIVAASALQNRQTEGRAVASEDGH